FAEWLRNLRELNKDFPIKKELLSPDERPDKTWAALAAFWNDPVVQPLVKADVERINRLHDLDGASRQDLIKAASESDIPEVALHAWRLLGQDGLKPAWPAKPGELAAERDLRRRLGSMLGKLKNPADRAGPADEIAAQVFERWRRFADNASSEAMLKEAIDLRDAFGVDADRLNKL